MLFSIHSSLLRRMDSSSWCLTSWSAKTNFWFSALRSEATFPCEKVPFLTCSVKSMWLVKEGSLPSTSPGEWPRPEPRPPTQGNISTGHKTDLVRCGKASSAVGLPRQVSQNPCLREAKNPKTISVSRQRLRGPDPPPHPPAGRVLRKGQGLGPSQGRLWPLVPVPAAHPHDFPRQGWAPSASSPAFMVVLSGPQVRSCLTAPRCLPTENALSPRPSP